MPERDGRVRHDYINIDIVCQIIQLHCACTPNSNSLCFVCLKLTVITVAVSTAVYDHGIVQQVVADEAEEFIRDRLVLAFRLRLLLWDKWRPLLLADGVRLTNDRQHKNFLINF